MAGRLASPCLLRPMSRLLTLACLLLALPVLGVLGSWAGLDADSLAVLRVKFVEKCEAFLCIVFVFNL